MIENDYFYLPRAYNRPADYFEPKGNALLEDTQHPELNSRAYLQASTNLGFSRDFLPTNSLLDSSEELFILGTNHFTSPTFEGNFIGAKNFDSIVHRNIANVSFHIPERSTVTGLKLLDSTLFITATKNCEMKIFGKTKEDEGTILKYGQRSTDGYVKTIDKTQNELKFVYGTTKGHIGIVDYDMCDLSDHYYYANSHSAEVTGVSVSPTSSSCWASCSLDRNCLIWDMKNVRPASGILRKYENQITAVRWTTQEENKELVMIGDEIGNVITLDPRCPNRILSKTRVSNRPITSFHFKGKKRFGVVSKSNVVHIMETEVNGDLKVVHKHTAPGIIYSMSWDSCDENSFYVVGEDKYASKVKIDTN